MSEKMITIYRVFARSREYDNNPCYKGLEIGVFYTEDLAKELCQKHMEFVGDPEGKQRYAVYEAYQVPINKRDLNVWLEENFASDLKELENELPF